jgi:ubiquinone/menaquinone biosynthesis C-methylase UbiE
MFWRKKRHESAKSKGASTDYQIIIDPAQASSNTDGWRNPDVVRKQDEAYESLTKNAKQGAPRIDLRVASRAVASTKLMDPFLLEVGCGSGYYSEILPILLHQQLRYIGLDASSEMVQLARRKHHLMSFLCADGSRLPFQDATFDIVLNGNALMHMRDYVAAISESKRVAKQWCIFHTVPLLKERATTMIRKNAYGSPVFEWIFNEREFLNHLNQQDLRIHSTQESIEYDLFQLLNEHTVTKTFLCEVVR